MAIKIIMVTPMEIIIVHNITISLMKKWTLALKKITGNNQLNHIEKLNKMINIQNFQRKKRGSSNSTSHQKITKKLPHSKIDALKIILIILHLLL